jgi:hypothetical protein
VTEFTPGRWEVLDLRPNHIAVSAFSEGVICRIRNEVSGLPLTSEDMANAHIIAAAPRMYEALNIARAWVNAMLEELGDDAVIGDFYVLDEIDKAMAAAEGKAYEQS